MVTAANGDLGEDSIVVTYGPRPSPKTRASAPAVNATRIWSACLASQFRGMKILPGRDPVSGRVVAVRRAQGFLLWRTRLGTP